MTTVREARRLRLRGFGQLAIPRQSRLIASASSCCLARLRRWSIADKSAQLIGFSQRGCALRAVSGRPAMVVAGIRAGAQHHCSSNGAVTLPFSRFRAKLVLALLGLTIVPSLLVLAVGASSFAA
jgi:hypothetical protein